MRQAKGTVDNWTEVFKIPVNWVLNNSGEQQRGSYT